MTRYSASVISDSPAVLTRTEAIRAAMATAFMIIRTTNHFLDCLNAGEQSSASPRPLTITITHKVDAQYRSTR